MKLVSSNEPEVVEAVVGRAIRLYREESDVPGAIGVLREMKGIGPATASLLLAVHDAEKVIFFADEAFFWLCCGGAKGPVKYDTREYVALTDRAKEVASRLGVAAVEVEKVAYVIMKQRELEEASADKEPGPKPLQSPTPTAKSSRGRVAAKRKNPSEGDRHDATAVRRPKRGRKSG